jgi:hypothetical protein
VTTVGQWLDTRRPAPPPLLAARIRDVLGDAARRDAGETADICLAAGERLLAVILRAEPSSREMALSLLAADALVTYAFEAASQHPQSLVQRAAAAMSRISALALEPAR